MQPQPTVPPYLVVTSTVTAPVSNLSSFSSLLQLCPSKNSSFLPVALSKLNSCLWLKYLPEQTNPHQSTTSSTNASSKQKKQQSSSWCQRNTQNFKTSTAELCQQKIREVKKDSTKEATLLCTEVLQKLFAGKKKKSNKIAVEVNKKYTFTLSECIIMRYVTDSWAGESPMKMRPGDNMSNDVFKILLPEFVTHVRINQLNRITRKNTTNTLCHLD